MSNTRLKEKEHKDEKESELEFSFHIPSIDNLVKYKKLILNTLFLLIPLFLTLFLRASPYFIPAADKWAQQTVYHSLEDQIYSQLQKSYPGLTPQQLQGVMKDELNKIVQEHKGEIALAEQQTAAAFRARLRNDNGTTYLLAIDPYFYLRNAENILKHGFEADIKTEKGYLDTHMLGGLPLSARHPSPHKLWNILPWIEVFIFKLSNLLGIHIDLMAAAFFAPVILGLIAVFIAFFVGKDVAKSPIGGFFAALFVGVHPFLLSRSAGGFADTDIFNALFPLALIYFFFKVLESNSLRRKLLYSFFFGLTLGIYTKGWQGWWYSFDLIFLSLIAYLIYILFLSFVPKRKHLKREFNADFNESSSLIISTILLLVFSALFVSWFSGFTYFMQAPFLALQRTELKAVAKNTIWPNVFTTVAELNSGNFSSIVRNNGGWFAVLIALSGAFLILTRKGSIRSPKIAQFFLALFWTLATIYAVYKGVRFNLLIVPAFAISWAIAATIIIERGALLFKKMIDVSENIAKVILFVLLVLIFVLPQPSVGGHVQKGLLTSALEVAKNQVPSMTDAWYETLTKIKKESKPNAIINSWWDFGHWFKAIADRAVTFDGASQNTPQAHWIGKVLLSNDEDLSIAILRMLDCGANLAYTTIYNLTKDDLDAINILYKVLKMDKEEAKTFLEERFGKENALKILNYTHCDPPEDFFITSEDMVGKAAVWAHFGSWNFSKAKMFYEVKKRNLEDAIRFLQQRFNLSELKATNLVTEIKSVKNADNWLAPWPHYLASSFIPCKKLNSSWVRCVASFSSSRGIILNVDVNKLRAYAATDQNPVEVRKFVMAKNGEVYVRYNPYSELNLGVIVKKEGDKYSFILSDAVLADSIFTRLFFLKGAGTNHFKLFSDKRDLFGNNIYVWKVEWKPEAIKDNFHILNETQEINLTPLNPENNTLTGAKKVSLIANVSLSNASNLTKEPLEKQK